MLKIEWQRKKVEEMFIKVKDMMEDEGKSEIEFKRLKAFEKKKLLIFLKKNHP